MSAQDVAYGITTTQITIGATQVIGISGGANCNSQMLLQLSGGTLWIIGKSLSFAAGATGGYPLASIPITIGGPSSIFIAESAGITSVLSIIKTLNPPSEF